MKKRSNYFEKKFSESMFESEVIVIITDHESISKEISEEVDSSFNGFYTDGGILWINIHNLSLRYLSHELIHFTTHQLKGIRHILLNAETEELYAYFYSYYLDKIWKRIEKENLLTMNLLTLKGKS